MTQFIDVIEAFEELLETAADKELYRLRDAMDAYAETPGRRYNETFHQFRKAVRNQIAMQEEMARDEEVVHGKDETK